MISIPSVLRPLLALCCLAVLAADDAVDTALRQAQDDPTATVRVLGELSARLRAAAPEEAAALAARLDGPCRHLFLEGWRVPGREDAGVAVATVEPGDSLSRLAKRRRITTDLLIRLNPGVDPRRIAVGARLVVLDAASVPLRLEVTLATRRLMLWRGPLLVMSCPVGIGAGGNPTPVGTTTIAQRVKDPEWRDPVSGKVHPPHTPGNILGGWWLGFAPGPDARFRSIGCHGFTGDDPSRWLGQPGSRGCVRLRQDDLNDLTALVVPGVAVEIR